MESFISQCKKLHCVENKFQWRCTDTSNFSKVPNKTKIIASIAIFSALYAVLRIMQAIPMIGVPGGSFSLSDVLAPLYGVILGPYVGGASVIIGTFLGALMGKPIVFLGLDFLPAAVNAIALGFLVRRKWAPVVVLNVALLAAFLLYPVTSIFVNIPIGDTTFSFPFAWLHIAALIVLISPLGRNAGKWIETLKPAKVTAGLAIVAFVGTMMQHLMGNLLFETVLAQPIGSIPTSAYAGIWSSIFFVYPVERLVLVVLAVIVGAPLVRVLKKSLFHDEKQTPKRSLPSQ